MQKRPKNSKIPSKLLFDNNRATAGSVQNPIISGTPGILLDMACAHTAPRKRKEKIPKKNNCHTNIQSTYNSGKHLFTLVFKVNLK